ncbi:hypothetical protein LMJ53_04860 [Rheinheimera sp. UJ51]|uniref:hypothetical protein n=1 Tax=Rheinheimera sp. UJ51 TaxID=2892446 RepID=UPI001E4C3E4E|nr:hypothetical protein [Rheinheimera sp. UJ51]MCC5451065.1 hypothetical protein [Rheinheimera sp. UJ51]
MKTTEFESEWCLLQQQFDSYEKHSLYIKLLSITVVLVAQLASGVNVFILLLLAVLWLQDAIWKTFQSRIEARLFQVEQAIAAQAEAFAFQFNTEYQKGSLTGLSLMQEYARQAIRPTVAFPYIVLILMLSVQWVV